MAAFAAGREIGKSECSNYKIKLGADGPVSESVSVEVGATMAEQCEDIEANQDRRSTPESVVVAASQEVRRGRSLLSLKTSCRCFCCLIGLLIIVLFTYDHTRPPVSSCKLKVELPDRGGGDTINHTLRTRSADVQVSAWGHIEFELSQDGIAYQAFEPKAVTVVSRSSESIAIKLESECASLDFEFSIRHINHQNQSRYRLDSINMDAKSLNMRATCRIDLTVNATRTIEFMGSSYYSCGNSKLFICEFPKFSQNTRRNRLRRMGFLLGRMELDIVGDPERISEDKFSKRPTAC